MRVLYFIPRYDSAAMGNRIHTEVIAEWRRHGVQAEVLALAAGTTQVTTTEEEGVSVHRLPVSAGIAKVANRAVGSLLPYPYLAGAIRHFRPFIRQRQCDLIHIETAFPLGLVAALGSGPDTPPLAVTLPGADIMAEPDYDYGYGRYRVVRSLLPWIFQRALLLRADSPQIRDLAIRLGAKPETVTTIPYNITADSFPPADIPLDTFRRQAREALVTRYSLDPQRPIVVSLNRLHPFKGIAYLVEALPFAREAGLWPQVLIVGPNRSTPRFGDYGAFLRKRSDELGVADDVHLTGGIPHHEAMMHLAGADAAVIPSVAESFSRVVIEAAAVGTPPIVTRTTGASAYVAEQQAGMVVDPRSGPAIAAALATLLRDRRVWEEHSRRAAALAPAFSSARIAADLLTLYQGALADRQPLSSRNH